MKIKHKIGQKIEFTKDCDFDTGFGNKYTVSKGSKGWVSAFTNPGLLHLENGKEIVLNNDDVEIEGYDSKGLAEFIYKYLKLTFPIDEMLEGYEVKEDNFKDCIGYALHELGFVG